MSICYCEDDDQITFITARPKAMKGDRERAAIIPDNIKYGPEIRDVFLRNKYRKVIVPINKISKEETSYNLTIPIYNQKRDNDDNAIAVKSPLSTEQLVDVVTENGDIVSATNVDRSYNSINSGGVTWENNSRFADMIARFDIGIKGMDDEAIVEWGLNYWDRDVTSNSEDGTIVPLIRHQQTYKKIADISSMGGRKNYPYVSGEGKFKYLQLQNWGDPLNIIGFGLYLSLVPSEIVGAMRSTIAIFNAGSKRTLYIAADKTYETHRPDTGYSAAFRIANSMNFRYIYKKLNTQFEDVIKYKE